MNTAWVLAEGDLASVAIYGRLCFSTYTLVVPPQPPFGSGVVTGLPFTASGTFFGHDVVGTGFANASFSGGRNFGRLSIQLCCDTRAGHSFASCERPRY